MDKIIIFDTEYTAWEGSQQRRWSKPWEHREVIQIAAVLVDVQAGFTELACFDRLVKPVLNPVLSNYISSLTGIVQQDVEAQGVSFADAFRDFYAFCQQGGYPLYSWGDDPGVLRENCELTGLRFEDFPLEYHDIRDVLEPAGIDTRLYSSGTVHRALELTFTLAGHNALNDVRSLSVTLAELSRQARLPDAWRVNGKCERMTIDFYNQQAQHFIDRTLNSDMSALYGPFLAHLPRGARILDAGCGSGRDSLHFLNQGYQVVSMDGSVEMVRHTTNLTGQPALHLRFGEVEFDHEFDAVWASASLLHVPKAEIYDVLNRLCRSLKPGGIFYLSFKYGNQEEIRNGRLFSDYHEDSFADLIAAHPELRVISVQKTKDVRPNVSHEYWLNAILQRKTS